MPASNLALPHRLSRLGAAACAVAVIIWIAASAGEQASLPRSAVPVIGATGVVDGATFDPGRGIASGAWVTVFGTNLAPRTRSWSAPDFVNGIAPTSLDGVSVLINSKPAFVAFIMRGADSGLTYDQINVLAPRDETVGPVPVEVVTPEGRSAPVTVNKVALAPAFFSFDPDGRKYLAATTADAVEYIGKGNLFGARRLDRPIRPARSGEVVTLYGSGFGRLDPALPDGATAREATPLAKRVVVRFGEQEAQVVYAGAAPNLAGVYQLNVRVPALPAGDAELTAEVDGVRTPAGRFLTTAEVPYPEFDHSKFSEFRLTGAHMFVDCVKCHVRSRFAGTPTACAACHLERFQNTSSPNHAQAGFPKDCAACHTTSQFRGAASHLTTRFQLTGAHASLDCAKCHTGGQFAGLDPNCAACHLARYEATTNPNHAAAGYPKDCTVCHTTATFKGAKIDHSKIKFALTGAHATLQCTACHAGGQYAGLDSSCANCHLARYTATTNPNHAAAGFPKDCNICHTTSTFKGAKIDHSKTKLPLAGAHAALECSACHSSGQFSGLRSDCANCHLSRYNATANPNHQAAGFPTDCALCHTTTAFKGAAFQHSRFALTGAHQRVQCASCHVGGRFAGTSSACVSCHIARYNATTNPNHQAAGFPTDCALCHSTTQFPGARFLHTRFALTGAHVSLDCARCHSTGRFAGTPSDCASCHIARYNATTNPNHAAAGFPQNCALCHTTASFRGATFAHTRFALTGAHQTLQCASCHVGGRFAGTPSDCASCHIARYNATTNPNHAAAGFPQNCALCHNTTQFRGAVFNHKFPIYSGEHAGKWTSCANCHVNPANFKEVSCVTCHRGGGE